MVALVWGGFVAKVQGRTMLLTLKVISYRGLPPSQQLSASFSGVNGSIGRGADNSLVLPDPENFISRHHADILFEGDRCLISDTSMSGTIVDHGQSPLHKNTAELCDGMRLNIGDYELVAEISGTADQDLFPGIGGKDQGSEADDVVDSFVGQSPSFLEEEPGFDIGSSLDSEPANPFLDSEEEKFGPDPQSLLEGGSPVFEKFRSSRIPF